MLINFHHSVWKLYNKKNQFFSKNYNKTETLEKLKCIFVIDIYHGY